MARVRRVVFADIMIFCVSEAGEQRTSGVGHDVALLVASCVTASGVVSLVCLHCLSHRVACRRRSTADTVVGLLILIIIIFVYYNCSQTAQSYSTNIRHAGRETTAATQGSTMYRRVKPAKLLPHMAHSH